MPMIKTGLLAVASRYESGGQRAEELLAATSLTVEKVAESAGYPSVEHFNRRFKKMHGLTPVQYRNKHNDNK